MKNPPISLIFFTIFLFSACTNVQQANMVSNASSPGMHEPTVEEVYTWFPPDRKKLKIRQLRQRHLDSIAMEISKLYLNHEQNLKLAKRFENQISPWNPALSKWESQTQQKIVLQEKRGEAMQRNFAGIKKKKTDAEKKLAEFKRVKPKKEFSYSDYVKAVGLFRDRKYQESIDTFKKVLLQKPPRPLMDNIHFAISSSYYHMKKYKKAVAHLDKIIKNYPRGDKWHMSYVMLGMVYNELGRKSQAMYGLDEVLKKNPPTQIINLVNRLRKIIDAESS